ncbi:hypothetical protein [Rubritalea marina]|uniref:hypothetical protein n=1 Tax=Rubritalea marina TaxID=361055 RepID=UPI00036BD26A|nr:hypothetical protein [Rubritalea marina]
MFGSKKKKAIEEALESVESSVDEQKKQVSAHIADLETFIAKAPEEHKSKLREHLQTIPAPEELAIRQRENAFAARLSKGELRNERRQQSNSAFLLLLLLVTIASLSLWIFKIISESWR